MKDFFEHQDTARKKTWHLVLFFTLAVLGIVLSVNALLAALFTMTADPKTLAAARPIPEWPYWYPMLYLVTSVGVVLVILLGSLYKTAQLASGGGESVALLLGGRRIDPGTRDPKERQLLNVVEEMAIASGVAVPPVFAMDEEAGINAFAAGHTIDNAVVGVSAGAMNQLDRDEIQGVIAHEFSHILNGDMRLNLRLIGVLHGILIIAILGWLTLRLMGGGVHAGRSRSGKDNGGGALLLILGLGIGLLVIGGIGVFFGRLIQSAVSRQREYLADASAVQFTRNPKGIAGALKKIGGLVTGSSLKSSSAREMSHLFFGVPFSSFLFSTHPPLESRIKRIDPSFDGTYPEVTPVYDSSRKFNGRARPEYHQGRQSTRTVYPKKLVNQSGIVGTEQLIFAAAMLEQLDAPLRQAAHDPYGARAVIYAVLLDRDPAVQKRQWAALEQGAEAPSLKETRRLAPLVANLPSEAILPLVETTFPALKQMVPRQYQAFRQNLEALITADEKVDLLEYTIRTLVERNLDAHFGIATRRSAWKGGVSKATGQVLSTLAHVGHSDAEEAARAFEKGIHLLKQPGRILPRSECTLSALDPALFALSRVSPTFKREFLLAAVATISFDGKVTDREAELYRAIGAIMGVPLPPIVA